jgi:SSS family transporter
MQNGLAAADYIIVAGFFAAMLGVGVFFARRMHGLRDFFSGGRVVPWWVSGVSLFMTTFSAYAFVGYSATAYISGFVAVLLWWIAAATFVVSARFLAARWRRAAATSPVEFIEQRYGPFLRQGFAWLGVPLIIIDDALKLYVIGTMAAASLGLDDPFALAILIAVCGVIILSYTFLGGLWAVLITDFVQFVVMAAAVLVLVPLVLHRVGGLGGFFSAMPEGSWTFTSDEWPPASLAAFLVVMLLANCAKWSVVQRYYAVRTDREARRVGYLVAILTIVGMPVVLLPALAARIFLPGIEDPNTVYSLICRELLPVGMLGMILAAMFSATMSMLSSDYNAVASVITNDIYRRFSRNPDDDAGMLRAGRLATLGVGVTALAIALALAVRSGELNLVQVMAKLFGVLLPPMAIPMIFGLLSRRASNAGALAAFFTGCACGLGAYFLGYLPGAAFLQTLPWLTGITAAPTLAALFFVSLAIPGNPEQETRVARFLEGLESAEVLPLDARPGAEHEAASMALGVIGWAAAGMGLLLILAILLTGVWRTGWVSLAAGGGMVVLGAAAVAGAMRLRGFQIHEG